MVSYPCNLLHHLLSIYIHHRHIVEAISLYLFYPYWKTSSSLRKPSYPSSHKSIDTLCGDREHAWNYQNTSIYITACQPFTNRIDNSDVHVGISDKSNPIIHVVCLDDLFKLFHPRYLSPLVYLVQFSTYQHRY